MQKRAARNISLSKYNSHTEPLFKRFRILKFEDLYKVNCATFMFNLAMGTHPPTICELVRKSANFNRNLEFFVEKLPYSYLQKQAPHTMVLNWNNLNIAHRNWLKEDNRPVNKNINARPTGVQSGQNIKLNNFRLNGFKNELIQSCIDHYSEAITCQNTFCNDCS